MHLGAWSTADERSQANANGLIAWMDISPLIELAIEFAIPVDVARDREANCGR
jgi:hypothetical protein